MTLLNETDAKVQTNVTEERLDDATLTFKLSPRKTTEARIKVIGVGGGGCNAAQRMASVGIDQVEVIGVNTDLQHLREACPDLSRRVQIGAEKSKGLGAGMDPEKGLQAAEESREELEDLVRETDMLFLTAGMGGGTGTGATPLIAELARSNDVLTVAVVTRPFSFEGSKRCNIAADGIERLRDFVDAVIIIPNDRLLNEEEDEDKPLTEAFMEANKVLHNAVRGISDLVTRPGQINTDFADVRKVMENQGLAIMGTGSASGVGRAEEAVHQAVNSQLLEEVRFTNASGILINITTNGSLTVREYRSVVDALNTMCREDANIVPGTVLDTSLDDETLEVTIVVAGFESAGESASATPQQKPTVIPMLKPAAPKAEQRVEEAKQPEPSVAGPEAVAEEEEAQPQVAAVPMTEGATALKPQQPDWNNGKTQATFNIPTYLRKQHD